MKKWLAALLLLICTLCMTGIVLADEAADITSSCEFKANSNQRKPAWLSDKQYTTR